MPSGPMSLFTKLLRELLHRPAHRAGAAPGLSKERMAEREPGCDERLRDAHALMRAGRATEAAAQYRQILSAEPANLEALNGFGVASLHLEDFSAAESALRAALAVSPDNPLIQGNLAVTLLRLQRLCDAEEFARSALGRDEKSAEAHFVLAQCLEQRGLFDDADRHYAECSRLDTAFAVCSNVRFSDSFFTLIEERGPYSPELPAYPMALADSGSFDYVVLISCDATYFERYGGSFINAFAQHAASRALLHVHFISRDDALVGRLQKLADRLGLRALQCSLAALPAGLNDAARSAYYASARYIYMKHWLERYGKPIACFDIDALPRSPLAPLVAAAQDADLGLVLRNGLYSPWTQIIGHTLVANPSGRAADYFETVARYLGHFFLDAKALWWLDQIALYCVLRHFDARGQAPRVVQINDAAVDAAWQITKTLGEKQDDALYAQYWLPV